MFDLAVIKSAHRRFSEAHTRAVDQALETSALTPWVWRWITQHGGFKSRTGNLVAKTKVKLIRTRSGRLVQTSNASPYANAQDGGSGLYGPRRAKYMIRAKNGQALAFHVGGRLIFRRSVMHPGVKPTRFLYNANDALFRTSKQWLRGAMARAAKTF